MLKHMTNITVCCHRSHKSWECAAPCGNITKHTKQEKCVLLVKRF